MVNMMVFRVRTTLNRPVDPVIMQLRLNIEVSLTVTVAPHAERNSFTCLRRHTSFKHHYQSSHGDFAVSYWCKTPPSSKLRKSRIAPLWSHSLVARLVPLPHENASPRVTGSTGSLLVGRIAKSFTKHNLQNNE